MPINPGIILREMKARGLDHETLSQQKDKFCEACGQPPSQSCGPCPASTDYEVTVKVCVIGDNPAKPEGSTVLASYLWPFRGLSCPN